MLTAHGFHIGVLPVIREFPQKILHQFLLHRAILIRQIGTNRGGEKYAVEGQILQHVLQLLIAAPGFVEIDQFIHRRDDLQIPLHLLRVGDGARPLHIAVQCFGDVPNPVRKGVELWHCPQILKPDPGRKPDAVVHEQPPAEQLVPNIRPFQQQLRILIQGQSFVPLAPGHIFQLPPRGIYRDGVKDADVKVLVRQGQQLFHAPGNQVVVAVNEVEKFSRRCLNPHIPGLALSAVFNVD